MMRRFLLLLVCATFVTAGYCSERTTNNYITAPSPTPTPVVADTIEYRVFGQVGAAPVAIKYTNSVDGVTLLGAASLPYVATIKNLDPSVFLDLEAVATPAVMLGSSLQVQIYVNGKLFREGFAAGVSPLIATASGTWRR